MDRVKDQLQFALGLSFCLASSFLYYVTLVQFGLMHHFEHYLEIAPQTLFAIIGVMAASGILGGILAGVILDRRTPGAQGLLAVIGGCSIFGFGLAFLSFEIAQTTWIAVVMAAMGLNLGVLIVALLYALNFFIPWRLRGIYAGFSIAASYLASNLLVAMIDEPSMYGTVNAIAIGLNVIVIPLVWESSAGLPRQPAATKSFAAGRFFRALAPLTLLVLLDTYCFYPVGQESFGPNPVLLLPEHWISNGILHALVALLGGMLAFNFGNRRLLQIGYVSLFASAGLLIGNHFEPLRELIHASYSVLVVTYTLVLFTIWGRILAEKNAGLWLSIGLAVCAWIGSGLGIASSMALLPILPFPHFFIPAAVLAPLGLGLLKNNNAMD